MVKKLFKHEILAWTRVMWIVYLIMGSLAVLGRAIQFFENDDVAYDIVFGSAVFAFTVAIIGGFVSTVVFAVVRFYRHLFTGEGYLTFTLPVTPTQHLTVKLLTALLALCVTGVFAFLSLCIITMGDVLVELFKAAGYLLGEFMGRTNGQLPLYIAEMVLLVLVTATAGLLLYYTCIAIGQRARKNRVLAAVGVYVGYYMATQVLSTMLMILLTALASAGVIVDLVEWCEAHELLALHLVLWGSTLWSGLLGTVYFFLTRYIMKNKLNLE